MNGFRARKLFLFAIISIVSLCFVQAKPEISPESNTKTVLYLSSSEIESHASLEQMKQLTRAFPEDTKFIYQYVNYGNLDDEGQLASLYSMYTRLAANVDLIVVADNLALEFVKKTQNALFNGIPVLVLGMSKGP